MLSAIRDLRHAFRTLLQQPGFLLVAVLTLALGIGANTAVFSVIHAAMIKPLPYTDPGRLVRIWETTPEGVRFSVSEPNYLDFVERSRSFEHLAAVRDVSYTLLGSGEPMRLDGHAVTTNFLLTLGVAPMIGPGFGDAAADAEHASVVLGHALWRQRFAGDPSIIGQTVVLEGRAHVVAGVMPADFEFLGATFWVPLHPSAAADRGDHWLALIARLRDGRTIRQAQDELSTIADSLGQVYATNADWGVDLLDFPHWLIDDSFRQTVQLLLAAVAALLLMACVNLANLLFVRNQRRAGEIGIRAALGARRSQLARLVLLEVLLLVALGLLLALPVAQGTIALLQQSAADSIPRINEVRLDAGVLAFGAGLALVTAILLALLPVWQAQRVDPSDSMREGGRAGLSRAQRRIGDGLVIAQVALALILLVGAGLLVSSFFQLRGSDPGFDPEQLLAVELQLGERYAKPWERVVFFNQLQERLHAMPQVAAAGLSTTLPFTGGSFMNGVTPVDQAGDAPSSALLRAHWRAVTPTFFSAMSLPLLQGRLFTASDTWDGPGIVVLSRTLAERLWPGEDAIGKELYWGEVGGEPRIVVGVVGDLQDVNVGGSYEPLMFLPYNQLAWPRMTLLIRSKGDPQAISAVVREQIRALDPTLPIPVLRPLREQMSDAVSIPRMRTSLSSAFAVVAMLLAAIGIYGVMAANLVQRQRELGLRLALGAQPQSLVALLLSKGARLAACGMALGLLGSWALTRLLSSLLYGVTPLDPLSVVAGVALLAITVLLASYLPASRAARLDPMLALRQS
jgi:putative ABC transport system permease protein